MLEMLMVANSAFQIIKQTLENGKELYTDYIQYCADARKARKEARIKSAKRKQHIQDTIMKVILAILITAVLSGAVAALFLIAKKKGLI